MKVFDKICKTINDVFSYTGMVMLVLMVIALFLQVFTRYVMHSSMSGTEEFARYAFIWITMMGASICVKDGSHATVSLLNDHLHGTVKRIHKIIIELFVISCACVLIYYGVQLSKMTMNSYTPTLRIPMGIIYMSLPLGMTGVVIGSINHIAHFLFDANNSEGREADK